MSRPSHHPQATATRAREPSVYRLNHSAAGVTTAPVPPQCDMSLSQRDNFDRVANMAREAYNIGKEILGELNVEDKIYTITTYVTSAIQPDFANNVAPVLLNAVPQSVNEAGRTGDSIEMRGIRITARIIRTNPTVFAANWVRVYLVYYPGPRPATMQNFPTTASSTDGIWDFELKSTTMAPVAQKDYDSKARMHILWDKTYHLKQDDPEKLIHDFVKLKGKHVQFENDTSAIASGSLELMWVSDQAAAATVAAYWHTRLYFVDN